MYQDYTTIYCVYYDEKEKKNIYSKTDFYYKDYPPLNGYDNISPVAKSDRTKKEWEVYWQYEALKKKTNLERWNKKY